MPGFTTHYLFGEYAYKNIISQTENLKEIVKRHRNVYNLGMEGPDFFFFYLPSILEWGINPGCIMHEKKTGEFFEHFIDYIMESKEKEEKEILYSYLVGFLGHYVIDYNCHPYIYHITKYNPYQKPPMRYHGEHIGLERDMDSLLLKKWKRTKPSFFQTYKAIKIKKKEQNSLANLLSIIMPKTYQKKIRRSTIKNAIITFRVANKWLCDKTGKKKKRMSKIENKILGFPFLSSLITVDEIQDKNDIFNLSHQTWSNPWDRKKESKASFFDLIHIAKKDYQTIIELVEKILKEEISAKALKIQIGNISYHSGL